mmetsp:Transcript_39628/g.82793  ORF Transcript_39628/g.82793 Transcript_39628/m.82793 type:complete len:255 (-) Transcript_39628:157-921(-)
MKTFNSFLFISIASASASTLRGKIEEVPKELPSPDASCFRKFNTAHFCEKNVSSDGSGNCVWCQAKDDGGVCLSNNDAQNAVELIGLPCPNYANVAVGTKPPDFNCFHAAWNGENAQDTCNGSRATDSSPCIWCSMDEGVVAGACLSSEEAIAANGKFGLTCPMTMYLKPAENAVKKGLPDVNCFKAAWSADNAESACAASKDKAGEPCAWCQTDGDAMGACLSKLEAGMANGQFGLKCPSNDAALGVSHVSES